MRVWTILVCLTLLPVAMASDDQDCERRECQDRSGPGDGAVDLETFAGRHVSFEYDAANLTLVDYRRGDLVLFSSIQILPEEDGRVHAYRAESGVELRAEEWRLRIQDNPTANLAFKGDGFVVFTLPDGASVRLHDEGARLMYGNQSALLVADDLAGEGMMLEAEEFAAFHIPARDRHAERDEEEDDDEDEEREERDAKVRDAIEKRRLGAEVRIQRGGQPEVNQYDDVEISVETPDQATPDTPLLVTLTASLAEGRTFVLDVDDSLLAGPQLTLRYFTIYDDGSRSEVPFAMASSLEDILDPDNDDGVPEYWVVEDANGLQVMASVPSWSTHQISLASIGEFLTQPSVIIGISAGLGGVAVAAIMLLRPRRQGI